MVAGMESFIQRFRDYSDCYTIIGGAACDILNSTKKYLLFLFRKI